MNQATPPDAADPPQPERIDAAFRNGSLTAVSVLAGFSLSFLTRWSAQPGQWLASDLVAVAMIGGGALAQTVAVARLLSVGSLQRRRYDRIIRVFLAGLALVGCGVVLALLQDLVGRGQRVLG